MGEGLVSGLPLSPADAFCQFLTQNLFADRGANAALIIQAGPEKPDDPIGSSGWFTDDQQRERFLTEVAPALVEHSGPRNQLLYPSLTDWFQSSPGNPLVGRANAILYLGDDAGAVSLGRLFVCFDEPLDLAAIGNIRQSFLLLRAGLRYFIEPLQASLVPAGNQLTRRQVAILQQVLDGVAYREVSKSLFVSESTVKQEAKRIFLTLGVRNRFEAARLLAQKP